MRRKTFAETLNPKKFNLFQRAMTRNPQDMETLSHFFSQRHPDNADRYHTAIHFPSNLPEPPSTNAIHRIPTRYPNHESAQPTDIAHSLNIMENLLSRKPHQELEDAETFVVPTLAEQEDADVASLTHIKSQSSNGSAESAPVCDPNPIKPVLPEPGVLKAPSIAGSIVEPPPINLHTKFSNDLTERHMPDLEAGMAESPVFHRLWTLTRHRTHSDENNEQEEQERLYEWRQKQHKALNDEDPPLRRFILSLRFWKWFSHDKDLPRTKSTRYQKQHWWRFSFFFGPPKESFSNYLQWTPTIHGNSMFVHLTSEQKEEMGGIEYRALKLLAKILVGYYLGWNLVGIILLAPWAHITKKYAEIFHLDAVNPAWWAVFLAQSAFNNVGFALTPDSLQSFKDAKYLLVITTFLMIIGYSGFPCLLRLTIWLMQQLSDPRGELHESVTFLLEHPRRCFTLLFPSNPTWWLFFIIIILNCIDVFFYLVLDINNPHFLGLSWASHVMDAIFSSSATRTSGLSVVDLNILHPAVVVIYAIMMYISIYPITISVRNTNVYEERPLVVYKEEEPHHEEEEEEEDRSLGSSSSGSEDDCESASDESDDTSTDSDRPGVISQTLRQRRPDKDEDDEEDEQELKDQAKKRHSRLPSKLPLLGIPGISTSWGSHIQRQLSFDMWFLFISFFVLCITDGGQIGNDQSKGQIPLFNVIFEVLSAYCTVGLSMGYPNTTPALSAQFSVLGKLIICLCLWRGRHRGLPYAIDRAVLLPMDLEQHDEDQERRVKAATTFAAVSATEEQAERNAERTGRHYSADDTLVFAPPPPPLIRRVSTKRMKRSNTEFVPRHGIIYYPRSMSAGEGPSSRR